MQNNQDPRERVEQDILEENPAEISAEVPAENSMEISDTPAEDTAGISGASAEDLATPVENQGASAEVPAENPVKTSAEGPVENPVAPIEKESSVSSVSEEIPVSVMRTDNSASRMESDNSVPRKETDVPVSSMESEGAVSRMESEEATGPVEVPVPAEEGRRMQDLHSEKHLLPKDEGTQIYADKEDNIDIVKSGRTYAGFFARLSAYLLDRLILLIPLGILRLILWIITLGHPDHILTQHIFFRFTPISIIMYVAMTAYFVLLTYITGRTIGKRIMRLKVVSVDAERKPTLIEILYRETFGRFLSGIVLCIGYFMIMIGDEKEALHDYLADTRVIYR